MTDFRNARHVTPVYLVRAWGHERGQDNQAFSVKTFDAALLACARLKGIGYTKVRMMPNGHRRVECLY